MGKRAQWPVRTFVERISWVTNERHPCNQHPHVAARTESICSIVKTLDDGLAGHISESAMETSGVLESRQIMFSFRIITAFHDIKQSNAEAPRAPLQISLECLNRNCARCVARDRKSPWLDVTTVEKLLEPSPDPR